MKQKTGIAIRKKDELQEGLVKAITAIDKKLSQLGVNNDYSAKTSGQYKVNPLDGNTVNIHNSVDLSYLLFALGKMYRLRKEYQLAVDALKLEQSPVPLYIGYKLDDWISDLAFRIKLISNEQLINALRSKRTELLTFQSAEERLKNSLNSLKDLLK